ncbi:uncharacterized protein B0I36DRAFT_146034 [Microdochium trichocladiopsis]|uniref:Uncharacterized protein n=1 Tax=Microdochium trichocladiopsis TaxID=1682393 RepID=A0A9P9BNQ6_9PEZI|nr:uncharacterized protein B0I36DRAFT_146034 [Microdochium trichocladiopsis]KAH7027986.1 hypothetical protein B0I36DRAFT_146034 [Microdochium trichocladiopsis]
MSTRLIRVATTITAFSASPSPLRNIADTVYDTVLLIPCRLVVRRRGGAVTNALKALSNGLRLPTVG